MPKISLILSIAFAAALMASSASAGVPGPAQAAKKKEAEKGKSEKPSAGAKAKEDAGEEDFDPNEVEFEKLKAQFEKEKDKEAFERVVTVEKFGDFPCKKTVPFLSKLMQDEKGVPGIIASAVKALGKLGTLPAVKAIIQEGAPQLLGDVNLTYLSTALAHPWEPEAEEWLIKNGLTELRRDKEATKIVIGAISRLKSEKKIPFLQGELKRAGTPDLKVEILRAFRIAKPKDVGRIVYPLIKDPDALVQVAALQVLEAIQEKAYLKEYVGLIKSPTWQVRAMAVDLLAACGHPEMVRLVSPLLLDPEPRVRIGAIRVLEAAGGDGVMDPLIKAMDKSEGRVLDDLADALTRLTGKTFGTTSVQWDSWWKANKGKVKIQRSSAADFAKLKEGDAPPKGATAVYYGLRVISKNICFVIDCSESMVEAYAPAGESETPPAPEPKTAPKAPKKSGAAPAAGEASKKGMISKMEVAKRELAKVLNSLPAGVRANIIRFNSMVEAWKEALTLLDGAVKKEALEYTKASVPEGMTNLYGALEEAFKDQRIDTIYLLSDGAPTLGEKIKVDEILDAVDELNHLQFRRIKINTIGFNLKPEEKQLMEQLADRNFGVFLSR
jgi:HEAT repeat protein